MSRETSTPLTRTFFGSTGRRKSAKSVVVVFSAIHTGRPTGTISRLSPFLTSPVKRFGDYTIPATAPTITFDADHLYDPNGPKS